MNSWPHAPSRRVNGPGLYMVTAATLHHRRLFDTDAKLALLHDALLAALNAHGYEAQAWAVFANHYHFIAHAPEAGADFRLLLAPLHKLTASALNALDDARGRRVWFNYRDTALIFERSYLARLAYVHNNPVKHGLATDAEHYPWYSARWFRDRADASFYNTVMRFKTDTLNVEDDY